MVRMGQKLYLFQAFSQQLHTDRHFVNKMLTKNLPKILAEK